MTDDAELRALEAAAMAEVALPADGHVVGEPVTISAIRYLGLPRVGLLATCQSGERTHEVGLADVVLPPGSKGAAFVARYRAWLGFDEVAGAAQPAQEQRPHKVASDDIVVGTPVELIVLATRTNALRCRLLGSTREVTLRTAVGDEIPGAIIKVTLRKQWTHARHPYISGDVAEERVDVAALGLVPLALRDEGEWDPEHESWGEEGEPIDEWVKPIIARGKRTMFEMEQVLPGVDPEDFDSDPIVEASELETAGDWAAAREILMKLLAQDLRCLDAHAHLGNFAFDRGPAEALRHYEMGVSIGSTSPRSKRARRGKSWRANDESQEEVHCCLPRSFFSGRVSDLRGCQRRTSRLGGRVTPANILGLGAHRNLAWLRDQDVHTPHNPKEAPHDS